MIPLAVALWLSQPVAAPTPSPAPWRLVSTASIHVGLRPHVLVTRGEQAGFVSFQVTVNAL